METKYLKINTADNFLAVYYEFFKGYSGYLSPYRIES